MRTKKYINTIDTTDVSFHFKEINAYGIKSFATE